MIYPVAVFLIFLGVAVGGEKSPSVETTSGVLIGKETKVLGKKLSLFFGVPYSLPPVGDLRFKAPLPYRSNDVLDAQRFKPVCFQPKHVKSVINPLLKPNQANMSEDCLYLNLYVPENNGDEELPVMVWLSGEGFSYADPTQFDGSFLASTQKMIVVTVSYRVSVFGFFNGLSEDAPGNVGLWDQRLALKWVQENIRAFGGNAGKITLSGRFSGAMSTVIHAVSPLSRDDPLFQRMILHSGVPDGKWIFNNNPLNSAMQLAEAMNCVFSNFSITISCLKKVSAEVLLKADSLMPNAWRPSLDFNLISETSLSELLKKSDLSLDVLVGTNNNEGSLCLSALNAFNSTLYEIILNDKLSQTDYERLVTAFVSDVYKESNKLVNDLISFTYVAQGKSSLRNKFVKFCGDLYINALSGKLEDILSANKRKVFVYELSHRPSFSTQPSFLEAGHGDDVLYAFGLPLQIQNLEKEEIQMTSTILKAISNFVSYGDPNALGETEWPAYGETKMVRRFHSHPEAADVVRSSHVNAVHFWQVIIPNVFNNVCTPSPMTSALVKAEDTDAAPHQFLGKWMSIPTAEYMIVGLLCTCGALLFSFIVALIIIVRHTSSMAFQRLK